MKKGFRKGISIPGVYRGRLHNQRNPRALWVPGPSGFPRIKVGRPRVSFYYGPPEKQKDPSAINMHKPKKK